MSNGISEKSRGVVLGLAGLLGVLGVHRFYVGKIGTGILMFLTGGGAAIWWIIDLVQISTGEFRDADGRPVLRWGVPSQDYAEEQDYELLEAPALDEELDAINEDLDAVTARLERLESPSPQDRG